MKKIILFALFAGGSLLASAQPKGYFGGFGFFEPGFTSINLSPINNLLTANGYSALGGGYLSSGGSGMGMINNLLIGGSGGNMAMESFGRNNTNGRFTAGYGMFQLGYAFHTNKKSFVYPMIGFGAFTTNMQLEDNNTTTSLNAALANPNQVVNLNSSNSLLDFSLNFAYRILGGGDENGSGGTMLGLSVGGFMSPTNASFQMNERDMTVTPNFRPSGFYVRLKIGGGGYGRSN